jgi:hypothetical protein
MNPARGVKFPAKRRREAPALITYENFMKLLGRLCLQGVDAAQHGGVRRHCQGTSPRGRSAAITSPRTWTLTMQLTSGTPPRSPTERPLRRYRVSAHVGISPKLPSSTRR